MTARTNSRNALLTWVILLSAVLNVLNYSPLAWNVYGGNIANLRVPLIFVFVYWFLILHRRTFSIAKSSPMLIWLLPTVAIMSGAILLPEFRSLAYGAWLLAAIAAIYFFLESKGDVRSSFESILPILFLANVVPVLLGLPGVPQYMRGEEARLLALGDMDQFNSIAAVVVFVSGYWILRDNIWRSFPVRIMVLALIIAAVPNIVFGGTRTAIVGIVIFFTIAVALPGAAKGRISMAVGMLIILSGFWIFSSNFANDATIDRITDTQVSNRSLQTRKKIYKANLRMALDYPFVGVGLTRSKDLIGDYGNSDIEGFSPHSTPIGVFSELGALGLFIFVALVLRATVRCWRRWSRDGLSARYFSIFLPVLGMCFFEYNLSPGQFLFYPLFLLLVLPLVRYSRAT